MIAAILVGVGLAVAIYILVGYPLLLAQLWRTPGPQVAKDLQFQPTVTVIVAVRNGGKFLRQKLESIQELDYPPERINILVVSDGSTDDTDAIAREFAARDPRVRLLRQEWAGKSTAINRALSEATGEILFFTDVRQPLNHEALAHLAANFADPSIGAVSGQLRLSRPDGGEQADMDLYWRYEIWVRHRHAAIGSIFGCTGCIYAMRRSLARPLPPQTLSDDVLLPVRVLLDGYRVIFEPAAKAFDAPAVAGSEFRRRWRTLAGLLQVFVWEPRIFTHTGRMWIHVMSHKFGRLLLPWALLLAFVASLFLPAGPGAYVLWAAEAGFVLLAALDLAIPAGNSLKRLTSPARMFLLMNVASLAAIAVFFISPQTLWKPTKVAG